MTIELYEMWRSEIYDRDLTSVGRIHDAMIQRGGGGGGGRRNAIYVLLYYSSQVIVANSVDPD